MPPHRPPERDRSTDADRAERGHLRALAAAGDLHADAELARRAFLRIDAERVLAERDRLAARVAELEAL